MHKSAVDPAETTRRGITPRLRRIEAWIVVGTATVMSLFQVVKAAVAPHLAPWPSHIATIVFVTALSAVVCHFVVRSYDQWRLSALDSTGRQDHLQAERERAEAHALRLSTAIEQAAEAVLITDARGRIEYVNPAAVRLSGYSREELLGQNPRLLQSGVHDSAFYEGLWKTIRAGRVWSGDITNRRKDGRLSVERTTIASVLGEDGTISHFIALKQDVTERRKEEEALERMQYSIDHAGDHVLWADAAGHVTYANEAAARSLGYSPEEMLGLAVWDITPDISPETWPRQWEEAKKHGTQIVERQQRRRNGTIFPVELTLTYVTFRGREYQCVIGHDITERKRAEEARRESEERYRLLFERNLAGVYRSRTDGRLLECNEAFARIFGYASREEVLGSPAPQLYPTPHARGRFLEHLRREGSLASYESEGKRKGGDTIHLLENATLVEGDLIEGTVVDVTDQKKLEHQLRQSQKMEAVGRLAGGVAHDFNNLLGVIIGYGDLVVKRMAQEDPLRTRVDQILKAAERAAGLTRQLLAFSRQQVLEPSVLDMNVVVSEMDKMLRRVIGEDIELVTLPQAKLRSVKADRGQLEQVLMNLVVNARDAMPQGGRLTIETGNADLDAAYAAVHPPAKPGRYVMLAVSDTGMGMTAEVQAHIFEPFFTTKESGKGTGLGLSTVYGIVKQSLGYIWVYSEVGVGTTFKIYLPQVEEAAEEKPKEIPAPPRGGSETVLLVEDEDSLRDLLRETLETGGYSILVAEDGAQALQIADSHQGPINLLLTDFVMPGMTGRAVMDQIRPSRPGMKVLFISGYADEAISRQGVLAPGAAFLGKPFSSDVLLRKVRQLLDKP